MFGKNKRVDLRDNGKIDTVIGEHSELKGAFQAKGTVRIDGFVEGTIQHDGHLIIGPTGRLDAIVKSRLLSIAGEVKGEVEVEGRLELLPGARLIGDIRCGHLVVHEGAMFEGRSQMLQRNDAAAGAENKLGKRPKA